MKRVTLTLLCLSVCIVEAKAQNQVPLITSTWPTSQSKTDEEKTEPGIFKFSESSHDYGTIPEGPKAEFDFEFINIGKAPIHIYNVTTPCGCTVANWPHEPIIPGKKGAIHVTYNTNGRPGKISKYASIFSDATAEPIVLNITGNVVPKSNLDNFIPQFNASK